MHDICVDGINVSFLFDGTTQEAATLRKKLQTKIYNYAIDKVIFYENSSGETEELLALKFGLLIINQSFITEGKLNIKGPKMVMANEITEIKSVHNMPIIYLRDKEILKCDFLLDKKCGSDHQKYNPVAGIRFVKHEKGFKFDLELTGVLTFDQIIEQL